jgi:hypothetical protein
MSQLDFYFCQAYIRHPAADEEKNNGTSTEDVKRKVVELISSDSSSQAIKRHVDQITTNLNENNIIDKDEQATAMKLVKLLERKRRKNERLERKQRYVENCAKKLDNESGQSAAVKKTKYVECATCKNPRGESCEHNLCRKCCKEKVFTEHIECKGLSSLLDKI